MPVTSEAPRGLGAIIDFVNTLDRETGSEALASPAALAVWLAERGLAGQGVPARPADLELAIELREALRDVLLAHATGEAPPSPAVLDAVAERGELTVTFTGDAPELVVRCSGVEGALARLLVPVVAAAADGSWRRVKACVADDCRWAFYDTSRNRSGHWCDMAVCGNRAKVRTYRQRRR